jgi:hypothetical protein
MKLAYLSKTLDRVFSVIWGITYKPPRDFRTFFPVSKAPPKKEEDNVESLGTHQGIGRG